STGQPFSDWQNGTPQSMQRAPWILRCSSEACVKISAKSPMRSRASRYGTLFFGYFMKPSGLPITNDPQTRSTALGEYTGVLVVDVRFDLFVVALALGEHALVVDRHDFDEAREARRPLLEHARGHGRARVLLVQLDHLAQLDDVLVLLD